MRFCTVPALLAAALFSAVVVVPFLPAAKLRSDVFQFEVLAATSAAGHLQIFYDDGGGYTEEASSRTRLSVSAEPAVYRLPLPSGRYGSLRIDPLDRDGRVVLHALRVVSRSGRVLRELPVREAQPAHQIARLAPTPTQGLEIEVAPGHHDPQIVIALSPPLEVQASWLENAQGLPARALPLWLGLAAILFALDRLPRWRERGAAAARSLAARPGRALAVVAAIAVIASAYPVVFLGQSYVSPNLGTVLLYDDFPTVPGNTSGETTDVKLSDVGAVIWQHVPFSMIQQRALAEGELPLWNRYNACGVPLLAQGQSMFGDPVHLLVVLANGAAWAWDLKYLIAKWLFALGLGLTVLAVLAERRTLNIQHPTSNGPNAENLDAGRSMFDVRCSAALIVSAAAPFIGFFLYRVNHPAFFSLCYAPWPLYCWVRVTQAATRRSVARWATGLIVANLALMNSGTVKEAYMLLACMNFSGACVLLAAGGPAAPRAGRPGAERPAHLGRLAKFAALGWAGVIFVLLTAPIWATFLQTLKSSYTGYNAVSAFQIQPTLLLGAFDEIFYRPLMNKDRVFNPSLNFLLLLGVLYFLATLRGQFANRAAIAIAASSLLPLSLAFGFISPEWIVRLPFLGNIAHVDNTFSCVLIVLWSVVAGVGFATALERLRTPEGRGDLIVAGLLLFALVFGWVAFRQAAHRPIFGPVVSVHLPGQVLAITPFIWNYLLALLAASALLALVARRALAGGGFTPARVLLLALGAAMLLWRHGLHAPAMGFETFTSRPTERADFHAKSEAVEFVRAAHAREPARGFGLRENFSAGWTGVYGLETVHGPDALVNPWVRELVGASKIERMWDWRLRLDENNVGAWRAFLDALNVRYYFALRSDPAVLEKSLTLRRRADLDVYESPTAWPRAFFTDRLAVYDQPAELIEKINAANGRAFAAAQRSDLAGTPGLATLSRELDARTVVPATRYELRENSTSFEVRASGPGVIVLTEALWPGDFRAELNGRKAPVRRLNHAFKGVVVDAAGDYRVTFRYWPRNFPRNLILCGTGAALLAVSLFLALRRRRAA